MFGSFLYLCWRCFPMPIQQIPPWTPIKRMARTMFSLPTSSFWHGLHGCKSSELLLGQNYYFSWHLPVHVREPGWSSGSFLDHLRPITITYLAFRVVVETKGGKEICTTTLNSLEEKWYRNVEKKISLGQQCQTPGVGSAVHWGGGLAQYTDPNRLGSTIQPPTMARTSTCTDRVLLAHVCASAWTHQHQHKPPSSSSIAATVLAEFGWCRDNSG